jgi:hypothetical protein
VPRGQRDGSLACILDFLDRNFVKLLLLKYLNVKMVVEVIKIM